MEKGFVRKFRFVGITLLMFALGDISGQNLTVRRDVYIDYLALKINFSDTFPSEEKILLQDMIEEEIRAFNANSKDFNVYLVPSIALNQPGVEINLDDLVYPSKQSQHGAFVVTLLGFATFVLLSASESPFFIIWWMKSLSEVKHRTTLSPALSSSSEKPLKYRVLGNGGWFKKQPAMMEIIVRRSRKKFQSLLSHIDNHYHVPRELRKVGKEEKNLATKFSDIKEIQQEYYGDELVVEDTTPLVSVVYEPNSKSYADLQTGINVPTGKDLQSAFPFGYNLFFSPTWKWQSGSQFTMKIGSNAFLKSDNGSDIDKEELWSFIFGPQFSYQFKVKPESKFSFGPLIGGFYNYGSYKFKGFPISEDDGQTVQLFYSNFSYALGAEVQYGKFCSSIYYQGLRAYMKPKTGLSYSYLDLPQKIDLSSICLTFGFRF